MSPQAKRDFQIFKLFVVLATMTVLFVVGLKVVLFAPGAPVREPAKAGVEIPAAIESIPDLKK